MNISPEKYAAMVIFSIPWFMALYELRRGWKKGVMKEYSRLSYQEVSSDRPDRYCKKAEEPKTFWCLFVFYLAIVIIIPIAMYYAVTHQSEEPKTNPGNATSTQETTMNEKFMR